MSLFRYLNRHNLILMILIILGACSIAGISFVYTVTQANDSLLLGSGVKTNFSFLPTDVVTPVGVVLLALLFSFLLSFLVYRGRFQPPFYATLGMILLSLIILLSSYLYPGMAGIVEYTDFYIIWALKETVVIMLFTLPVSFVGAAVGIFFGDRLED